jgi:hypothetical protein
VNSEKSLQKAVAHQPVSVAIEASGRAFQLYSSVIITNTAVGFLCHAAQFRDEIVKSFIPP